MGSHRLSTTAQHDVARRRFRVTHPHHPWVGREFELLLYKHHWGEDRVYCHADDGDLIGLPASWTDVVPADPIVVVATGRAHFRAEDLWALAQLVRRLAAAQAGRVKGIASHV
jgi:Family of unknown function (DUF5372)